MPGLEVEAGLDSDMIERVSYCGEPTHLVSTDGADFDAHVGYAEAFGDDATGECEQFVDDDIGPPFSRGGLQRGHRCPWAPPPSKPP